MSEFEYIQCTPHVRQLEKSICELIINWTDQANKHNKVKTNIVLPEG